MRLGATPNHKKTFYNKINRDDKGLRVFRYELSTRGAYREKPYRNGFQLFFNAGQGKECLEGNGQTQSESTSSENQNL
jgi:hypothetical protein